MTIRPTKVPGFPKVPASVDPQTRQFLAALVEAVEIRLGRKGDPIDRAITLRELIESGLAKRLKETPFDPNNVGITPPGIAPIVIATCLGILLFIRGTTRQKSGRTPQTF